MSTKNLFHSGPEGPVQSPPLLLFLLLSLLVHGAAYLLVLNSGTLGFLIPERSEAKKGPIEIEMVASPVMPEKAEKRWIPVIDLPSNVKSDAPAKKEIYRFADRDVSVTKESVPKPGEERVEEERTETSAAKEKKGRQSGATARKEDETPATGRQRTTIHKAESAEGVKSVPKEAVVVPPYMRTNPDKGALTTPAPGTEEATGAEAKRPSLFPSGERLSELAKNSPSRTRRGKTGHIMQLNTTELIYQKYLLNVRDRVSFYWEYPIAAARNGWQGTLTIDFVVSRNGEITEVKIDRSSGYPVLDDAAITAIKLAGPFFTFPEHFILDKFNIKYQFEYRLSSAPPPAM